MYGTNIGPLMNSPAGTASALARDSSTHWFPMHVVSNCYLTIDPAMILKDSKLFAGGDSDRNRASIIQIPAIPEKHMSMEMVERTRDLLERVDAYEVSDASEREATLSRIAEHEKEAAERAKKAKEEEEQRRRAEERARLERDRREIERRQEEILKQNQLRKQQEERAAAARLKLQQQKAEEEKRRLAEEQAEFERQRAENLRRQAEILKQSELRKQQEERAAAARLKLEQQKVEEERKRKAEEEAAVARQMEETAKRQAEIMRQNELRRQQEADFAAAAILKKQQEEEERKRKESEAEAKLRAVQEAMKRAGADPLRPNPPPVYGSSLYQPQPQPQPQHFDPVDQAINSFAKNRSLFDGHSSNARHLLEKMLKDQVAEESAVAASEEYCHESSLFTYRDALNFARAYTKLVEQARRWPSVQRSMYRHPLRLYKNDVNSAEQYLLTMNNCLNTYSLLTFEDIAFLLELTGPNGTGAGGIKQAAETFSNLKDMGFPLDRIKWAMKERGVTQAFDALLG